MMVLACSSLGSVDQHSSLVLCPRAFGEHNSSVAISGRGCTVWPQDDSSCPFHLRGCPTAGLCSRKLVAASIFRFLPEKATEPVEENYRTDVFLVLLSLQTGGSESLTFPVILVATGHCILCLILLAVLA